MSSKARGEMPMTFEETLSRLFDRRILLCDEAVNDVSVGRLRVGFINLNLLDGEKAIRFYIDTRSGDVDETLRLVSTMDTIDAPIIALADGRSDILGLALLQACDVRLSTRFAAFSIQGITSSSSYRYSGNNVQERYTLYGKHLEMMQEKLDRVVVGKREGSALRSMRLKEMYEQNTVVCGEDLAKTGFIDEIIESKGFWAGERVLIPSRIGF